MKLNSKFPIYVVFLILLVACQGQTKEDMVREGQQLSKTGNPLGAIVYFRNALEKDPNYAEARYQLGLAYLKTGKLDQAEKELRKVQLLDPGKGDVLLDLASIALINEENDEAEENVNRFIRDNGKTSRSQQYLGMIRQAEGNFSLAGELFQEAMELDPKNAEVILAQARLYLIQKLNDEARNLLKNSLDDFPDNKNIYQMLATIEARKGNRAAAIDAYEQVIRLDPNSIDAHYFAGLLSLDGGDVAKAKNNAEELRVRFPDHPAGARLSGMISFVEGDFENAATDLQKSLIGMPDLAGYYFLGLTEFRLKNYEMALNQFQKALDLNPDHLQSRVLLGMTLLEQKRIEDGIYQISMVLQADDSVAIAHNVLGTAYLKKGDYDAAAKHFDRAIELEPRLADPHLKKGLLSLTRKDETGAELELEKALAVAPESLNTRFLLASLYLRQQNYQGVIDLLEVALKDTPQDALLYNYMAAAYLAQKKNEEGIKALKKAKDVKSDYLAPYFNLANVYLKNQQQALAVKEYQSILDQDPNNIKALVSLASLQEVMGSSEEAQANYQRARETNDPRGYLALAGYWARSGSSSEFKKVVEEAYIAHPENPAILELRGRLKLNQKDYVSAANTFESLDKVRPGSGSPLLALTWVKSGEVDKALSIAQSMVDSNPKDATGYLLASAIHQQLGQTVEAETSLRDGIEKASDKRVLSLNLAKLHVKQEEMQDAKDLLNEIREQYPDFVPATFAMGMLQDQIGNKQKAATLYQEVLDKVENHTGAMNNLAYLYAENYAEPQRALELAMKAFQNEPNDPTILDTLGLALFKNQRYAESVTVLSKAAEMLPGIAVVHLHLGQALIGADRLEKARQVLQHVINLETVPESEQAKHLLKKLNAQQ